MVNLLRFSVLSWLVLAVYFVAGCSAIARAEDAPTKERSKARARAALALASTEITPAVVADPPVMAARAAAKAALKACGPNCPCGACDCETCECCKAEKVKPMPPASPPEAVKAEPNRTVVRLPYSLFAKSVEKLKPGESLTVYVGQDAPASATGALFVLTDAIPNEEQRIGVWRCWNDGELKMASMQPAKGGKRIVVEEQRIVGDKLAVVTLYLDEYPDGSRYWCVPCNKGK